MLSITTLRPNVAGNERLKVSTTPLSHLSRVPSLSERTDTVGLLPSVVAVLVVLRLRCHRAHSAAVAADCYLLFCTAAACFLACLCFTYTGNRATHPTVRPSSSIRGLYKSANESSSDKWSPALAAMKLLGAQPIKVPVSSGRRQQHYSVTLVSELLLELRVLHAGTLQASDVCCDQQSNTPVEMQ